VVHLAWGPNNSSESYRRFLSYVFHKLQAARDDVSSPAGLSQLPPSLNRTYYFVKSSLEENHGERLAKRYLRPVLRKVRTFGFHLYTLDNPPACRYSRTSTYGN